MRIVSFVILLLLCTSAAAQPGGSVTGAIQYRSSTGTFAGDDNFRSNATNIILNGKPLAITALEPLGVFQTLDWAGRTVTMKLDGQPASGGINMLLPVSGKTGTFTVVFSQDLNTIAELDTQLVTAGSPAMTNMLGGGNSWINLGTINERAATPATPASGFGELWIKTSGEVYVKDDGGADRQLLQRASGTDLGIMRQVNGKAETVPGSTCESTGVCTLAGLVVTENTTNDTNAMSTFTNNVAGGTLQTCASADWHGPGKISLGDLHAGIGNTNTFPELCADDAVAPMPKSALAGGNAQSVSAAVTCAPFDGGTAEYTPASMGDLWRTLLFNPNRPLRLRALSVMVGNAATVGGWETNELMAFRVYRCLLDTSPAIGDCSEVDRIVLQNSGTPTFQYGETGNTRTAKACAGLPCRASIDVDGKGLPTPGVPNVAVGGSQRDYGLICWQNTGSDWTADGGTNPGDLDLRFELEYWN